MTEPSLLARHTFGLPHYLWLAIFAVVMLAFIPPASRRAVESNSNRAEDWLPADYAESADLDWYRQHFGGEAFIVASWEGCTLEGDDRLTLLATKLRNEGASLVGSIEPEARMFSRVVTGRDLVAELTTPPAGLSRDEAIARLEGAVVGPLPKTDTGEPAADGDRLTCLVAWLGPEATANNKLMRVAIERLVQIATTECNIPGSTLHYGGPPVDNVTIDIEAESTLRKLAWLSGLVGLTLAYLCFRSLRVTGMVLAVAVASAMMSLALVFYWSVVEIFFLGYATPHLGRLDAIMMSMPAVVYVLGLSGGIHLVNYYRDAVAEGGRHGAVERAVRMAWLPGLLAALTTALGLASLGTSDILPIKKFGIFTAAAVVGTLVLLYAVVPVGLHRFPPVFAQPKRTTKGWLDHAVEGLGQFVCRHATMAMLLSFAVVGVAALGLVRLESRVQLLKLLDPSCPLITHYAWFEKNLGNLVPMEVVVSVPASRQRGPDDAAETDQMYRMSMYERLQLVRAVSAQIEQLPPVSHTLSVATFAPTQRAEEWTSLQAQRSYRFGVSQQLASARGELTEYLRWEKPEPGKPAADAAELWRVSARIAALSDIDYGQFVDQLKAAVAPVLATQQQRDKLVATLQRPLVGARIAIIYPTATTSHDAARENPLEPLAPDAPEQRLKELLDESGVGFVVDGRRGVVLLRDSQVVVEQAAAFRQALANFDAVVVLSPQAKQAVESLGSIAPPVVDCTQLEAPPSPIEVTYTGVVPVVYKTQRELLVSLHESMLLAAVMITGVMMVPLRSVVAGFLSMLPNVFPIVVVFGALGWAGIKIDIGIMMTASVALGVAVDDTLHFVTWFMKGRAAGMDRRAAVLHSYDRCGRAMVQTTLIAGLGLAVFSASSFTPTRQFGILMITILAAALVGDLIMLPAMLVGPFGRFFGKRGEAPLPESTKAETVADVPVADVPVAELPAVQHRAAMQQPDVAQPAESQAPTDPSPASGAAEPNRLLDPQAEGAATPSDSLRPHHLALRDRLRALRDKQ